MYIVIYNVTVKHIKIYMIYTATDVSKIEDKPTHLYYSGLDTYFFLNLAVGQPSNNVDLSEIEIYLGIMIIFFLFR